MRVVIACALVESPPGIEPYPHTHYEQRPCPSCRKGMYVGPRSIEKHERDGTPLRCMLCVLEESHGFGTVKVASLGGP